MNHLEINNDSQFKDRFSPSTLWAWKKSFLRHRLGRLVDWICLIFNTRVKDGAINILYSKYKIKTVLKHSFIALN